MGSGVSRQHHLTRQEQAQVRSKAVQNFRQIHDWYRNREEKDPNCDDDELADKIEEAAEALFFSLKDDETRSVSMVKNYDSSPTKKIITTTTFEKKQTNVDNFMDSELLKQWLNAEEANNLFYHLKAVGEENRPRTDLKNATDVKYPLWSLYYGFRRKKDGARALDRWGSYHESWIRVLEPTEILAVYCQKLRDHYGLSENAVNSVVVNYYFDGDSTYIPAHRDTTACLEEDSRIYCLSLGASRDFVLTANEDCGKFEKSQMTIAKGWRVNHGDIFALGQQTNEAYCHAVPQEKDSTKMRISVIFRSISKSFIDLNAVEKTVEYASGNIHKFHAECVVTRSYDDEGKREHISDLIKTREVQKLAKKVVCQVNKSLFCDVPREDIRRYYLGEGSTVPIVT